MYSKTYFKFNYVFLAVWIFLISACGLKFGEETPHTDVAEMQSTKCLSQSIETLKIFFDGNATDSEVDRSFACLSQVLISFKDHIRGSTKDRYTPQELTTFIEKNFLKDHAQFDSNFIAEIMALKVVLVGGAPDSFHKKDIESLSNFISRLGPAAVQLNPHMKVLTSKWDVHSYNDKDKEIRFLASKKASLEFFRFLANELSQTGQSYKIDRLVALLKQAALFAKASPESLDRIDQFTPFLIQFKKHLISEGPAIRSEDWRKIARSLHEMLFQLLRLEYFVKPLKADDSAKKWEIYGVVAADVTKLLSELLTDQPDASLSNDQIYELLSSLLPTLSPDLTLSQDLVQGLSQLKLALLKADRSSGDNWTAQDLNLISLKAPRLFPELQILFHVFKKVDHDQTFQAMPYNEFSALEIEFISALDRLSQQFEGAYSFEYAKKLLLNIEQSKLIEGFELPANLDNLFLVAQSAKAILSGVQGPQISNLELRQLISIGGRIYFHTLEFERYLGGLTLQHSEFSKSSLSLVEKVYGTLTQILKEKPSQFISNSEILDLYSTLQKTEFLSVSLSSASVETLLDVLWQNLFIRPENRLAGLTLPGFNIEAAQVLLTETQYFLTGQYQLAQIFENQATWSQSDLLFELQLRFDNSKVELEKQILMNFVRVIDGTTPLLFNSFNMLTVLDSNFQNYTYQDVAKSFLSQVAARLAVRSFALEQTRIDSLSGVTLSEAEAAFAKLKALVFELDLVDPANTEFIASRFREANLFVNHSNGDALASLEELHDLILHIYSGLNRAEALKTEIVGKCKTSAAVEEIDRRSSVPEACLLGQYYTGTRGFENLPAFLDMKNTFSADQMKGYYLSLLKAAGHVPNEEGLAYFEYVDLFPHVVQYVEMLFANFDADRNGQLAKDEALKAYPVFRPLLKDLVSKVPNGNNIPDSKLPGVFIYLLKFGRPPQTPVEYLKFAGFLLDEKKWEIQSTRLDVGLIFNFLADSISEEAASTAAL